MKLTQMVFKEAERFVSLIHLNLLWFGFDWSPIQRRLRRARRIFSSLFQPLRHKLVGGVISFRDYDSIVKILWNFISLATRFLTPTKKNAACHLEFICAAIKKAKTCGKAWRCTIYARVSRELSSKWTTSNKARQGGSGLKLGKVLQMYSRDALPVFGVRDLHVLLLVPSKKNSIGAYPF